MTGQTTTMTMEREAILLVEDDWSLREMIQEILEEAGYDVVPARNGKQALDFLTVDRESPPALILLDLMLPLVTGWQVLEAIRGDERLARVPVVVMTGVAEDRPVGASALLQKPLSSDHLLAEVRAWLADRPRPQA